MKLHSGITLALLVALTNAAPRSPSIVQVYQPEQVEEDPRAIAVDYWPREDVFGIEEESDGGDDASYPDTFLDPNPFLGSVDLAFNVNKDNIPILVNDTITNLIFKDLEHRIAEDIRRMQEDFLLFQRLFGQKPASVNRPSWFLPWGISPDYAPEDSPTFFPDAPEDDPENDPTNYDYSSVDDNFFNGFPFLGVDRPMFPGLPEVPGIGIANPENLPDNYNNKTHEVHSINGTEVVVNNTINKESGDGFSSFFHHQVIHFKPEEEEKVPEGDYESASESASESVPESATEVPVNEVPREEDKDSDNGIDSVLPEVENEVNTVDLIPENLPGVNPEVSLDGSRPEEPAADNDDEEFTTSNVVWQQAKRDVVPRSLHEFNPIVFPADDPNARTMHFPGPVRAAYISSNKLDDEEDFEEVETGDGERRAPDLSNDTRVNRIHANKQGMTRVDPDAEIFNYGLVMREGQPQEGDK